MSTNNTLGLFNWKLTQFAKENIPPLGIKIQRQPTSVIVPTILQYEKPFTQSLSSTKGSAFSGGDIVSMAEVSRLKNVVKNGWSCNLAVNALKLSAGVNLIQKLLTL